MIIHEIGEKSMIRHSGRLTHPEPFILQVPDSTVNRDDDPSARDYKERSSYHPQPYISTMLLNLRVLVLSALSYVPLVHSLKFETKADLLARRKEAVQHLRTHRDINVPRAVGVKNITFSNPKASEFYVDGTSIPEVDFDVGPSWAGLLPISSDPDETRKMFFWFFPPGPQGSLDDIIFWTNGGPGCSSLEGLLQENGPFQWGVGTAKPVVNEYSWTNLSSILWVEQPIGTGFTQGTPNITNEDQLAEQLVGFFNQFLEVFSELKGKNVWLTGESYAGVYVPYIANWIYEHPDQLPDWNLKGIWIGDPLIGDLGRGVQTTVPAVSFVEQYLNVFALNQTFLSYIKTLANDCGFTDYLNTSLAAPPAGPIAMPDKVTDDTCGNIWNWIVDAALLTNPAFNVYRVFDTYPILWDVLGFPGTFANIQTSPLYFDREDVKKAIHAPTNVTWNECNGSDAVFPSGDNSDPVAWKVLPNVIQKSNRTVIAHGLADFFYMAEGARIVIQNMTWNGMQGFQTDLQTDSFVVDGMGALGRTLTERGLTYVEIALSGHMVPQFSPVAAYQTMQYLMGFRDDVSA
ncbi:hypothetical protein VNI00_016301 [Paramarasmius palmivorus]|uniref:Carboxypeptidase n=1 Tax=Paramarasmius palmivorus TaxID=297713 RepID=A0AAW0BEL3_9AGAR